jgi:anti-sigma regulatory factor (Ser/Thr protein kinase)
VPLDAQYPAAAAELSAIRQAVAAYAREVGAPPEVVARAVQAVHEAAANAVIHGYGGGGGDGQVIDVSARDGDGWLRFRVSDAGLGFRPSRDSPGYGLGLAIIAQLADELEIGDNHPCGLTVHTAFRLG